jgi:hypothetical protein
MSRVWPSGPSGHPCTALKMNEGTSFPSIRVCQPAPACSSSYQANAISSSHIFEPAPLLFFFANTVKVASIQVLEEPPINLFQQPHTYAIMSLHCTYSLQLVAGRR